jgi:hypothetical protein
MGGKALQTHNGAVPDTDRLQEYIDWEGEVCPCCCVAAESVSESDWSKRQASELHIVDWQQSKLCMCNT